MRPSEFEEREYEAPLYVQLQHASTDVWSPGQVLEAHVGFDHALFTSHPYFWKLQGLSTPPSGVVLGTYPPTYWWPEHYFDRLLPDFALNLFIQAKRPFVGSRATKALKAFGVRGPYWKFLVYPDQQKVLESLAKSTDGLALVSYACAAFDRVTELWAHSRAGTIVQQSTFPPATSLHGHEAWYYTLPGCQGIANPTPERIEGPPLLERIREFRVLSSQRQEGRSFEQNLKRLAAAIRESLSVEAVGDFGRTAVYFEVLRELERYMDFARPARNADAIRSYLSVAAFVSVFGLYWHVLGPSNG